MSSNESRGSTNVCGLKVIHLDVVKEVSRKLPEINEIKKVSELFKIFSDSSRLSIIWALNESEMCVCDLCELLKMKQSAVSHQLRKLKVSRVVNARRDGKVIYYSLSDNHIAKLLDMGIEHVAERSL